MYIIDGTKQSPLLSPCLDSRVLKTIQRKQNCNLIFDCICEFLLFITSYSLNFFNRVHMYLDVHVCIFIFQSCSCLGLIISSFRWYNRSLSVPRWVLIEIQGKSDGAKSTGKNHFCRLALPPGCVM